VLTLYAKPYAESRDVRGIRRGGGRRKVTRPVTTAGEKEEEEEGEEGGAVAASGAVNYSGMSCRASGGQVTFARARAVRSCRHVSGLSPAGCVGKEAACDTCNRLHFVPGRTLLSGFTLSCTGNGLTFPSPCGSIYFGHLGFQGAVDVFVTAGSFQVQRSGRLLLDNVS
jgi:hypothetical protein